MLNVVSGGAGFVGSHLVNALLDEGDQVVIVDNLSTGHVRNLEHALNSGRATLAHADVAIPYAQLAKIIRDATTAKIDRVYHLASPASPNAYGADPWGTLAANGLGTMTLIDIALHHGSRFLFASTSEIYGDPLVHPQPESYFGNVDPIGPRSCYDEGKRFGEAAVAAAVRARGLDGRIVRLFNCYGPSMSEGDGRLIPALIEAAQARRPFPIHGTGKQTRSMTYVRDAVYLIRKVMDWTPATLAPVNVGGDDERSVEEIARTLARVAGVEYIANHLPPREQDPQRRRPDLALARSLGWSPSTSLEDGLFETYRWFSESRVAFA
ncbi:MAG TPA: NAD-dependent epimerase/dehydratase family protein [Candidatus Aquilonibacter sp.]